MRTAQGGEDRNTGFAACPPKMLKSLSSHELPGIVFHRPIETAEYGLRGNTATSHIAGSEGERWYYLPDESLRAR